MSSPISPTSRTVNSLGETPEHGIPIIRAIPLRFRGKMSLSAMQQKIGDCCKRKAKSLGAETCILLFGLRGSSVVVT
jgi:hypothetical protein